MTHIAQDKNRKLRRGLMSISCSALLLPGCYTGISAQQFDDEHDSAAGSASDGDEDDAGDGDDRDPTRTPGLAEDHTPTPLARLTNDEFINSVAVLLDIPRDSEALVQARGNLAAEPNVGGLFNDADRQLITHVGIASYSGVASTMTDVFLAEVATVEDLALRMECPQDAEDGLDLSSCTRQFGANLLSKAFRRDATDQEIANIEALVNEVDDLLVESDQDLAAFDSHILRLRTVVRYVLLSADFLLLVERGTADAADGPRAPIPLTSAEIATRLSYFITGAPPDEALMVDVHEGRLSDPSVRLEHADRLLDSEAGRAQLTKTLNSWLGIDAATVDAEDAASLSTFIDEWFAEEKPFEDLYKAPVSVVHVDETQTEEPFGVLGLRAFVASHSAFPTPSFITRGVFVVERLLCSQLPSDIPAEALDGEEMTPLEVFQEHAKEPCATCHVVFDNYGAAFQRFDTETSRYDPEANELGDSFDLLDLGGVSGVVGGVADLGRVMGQSERAPACLAELWYRKAARRGLDAGGEDDEALDALIKEWQGSGNTSMKSLMRSIVTAEDFTLLFP